MTLTNIRVSTTRFGRLNVAFSALFGTCLGVNRLLFLESVNTAVAASDSRTSQVPPSAGPPTDVVPPLVAK